MVQYHYNADDLLRPQWPPANLDPAIDVLSACPYKFRGNVSLRSAIVQNRCLGSVLASSGVLVAVGSLGLAGGANLSGVGAWRKLQTFVALGCSARIPGVVVMLAQVSSATLSIAGLAAGVGGLGVDASVVTP